MPQRMKLSLQPSTLLKRYKRFLADVVLEDGTETTIHVANTGAMTGCATPNDLVWYSTSSNPKRKYPFSWELTETQDAQHLICVNTARANQLAVNAINLGITKELLGYKNLQTEVKYGGENSRIDIFLSDGIKPDAFVEVKSVTLLENGMGYFPDAVTIRGQKHLRELMAMIKEGKRAILLFTVLHTGINHVRVADHIDPQYGSLLREAQEQGVEILAYKAEITTEHMHLTQPVPLSL